MILYFVAEVSHSHYINFWHKPKFSLTAPEFVVLTEGGKICSGKLNKSNALDVMKGLFEFIGGQTSFEPTTVVVDKMESWMVLQMMHRMNHPDVWRMERNAILWDVTCSCIEQSLLEYMDFLDDDHFDHTLIKFKAVKEDPEQAYTRQQKLDMFKSQSGYPVLASEDPDLQDKVLHLRAVEQFLTQQKDFQITLLKLSDTTHEDDHSA